MIKFRWVSVLTTLALALSAVLPNTAFAAAYGTPFVTSITYQNLSSSTANIVFTFYTQDSGTTVTENKTLAGNAGSSLYLGAVAGLSAGFHGSAIMSSDQPVLATTVQVPQSATVKNRPLSNGFSEGASRVLIATALKNHFSATSILSVQNVDSVAADITVRFYPVGSAVPLHTANLANLPAGAAHYFDLGTISELGGDFNGSVTVESADDGGAALSGSVVAAVMEMSTTGNGASAFEGVNSGSGTVYMPSALCDAFGGQNSAYAVQNTSNSTPTDVTVTYSNGSTQLATIPAGGKQSFIACTAAGMASGFSGSAVITASGPAIIAIGKVYGTGLSTAFVGAAGGAESLALPYVRWGTQANYDAGVHQRTFLAIQNVGGATITGNVVVRYLDKNGTEVGTHTITTDIPVGGKVNSNASLAGLTEFGMYGDGTFGGSVLIEGPGGSALVAIARVQSVVPAVEVVGEDYNGIPLP
ncbi:MAG: hypothetical protein IT317_09215 [Anaerolineales bacterium]|nr:hypothetical protein [Anaerolineales bacterium]